MILRIAAVLLLCSASLPLMAREVRQASPNGGCPTTLEADAQDEGLRASAAARRAETESVAKDKAVSTPRGGNAENSVRTPRMHSFLPGMFR